MDPSPDAARPEKLAKLSEAPAPTAAEPPSTAESAPADSQEGTEGTEGKEPVVVVDLTAPDRPSDADILKYENELRCGRLELRRGRVAARACVEGQLRS